MSSILTNVSALTALQNLANTQNSLSKTQNQISTGLAISSAADNASNWSIASTMQSDNGALGVVNSALGHGVTMVNNAYTAVTQSISAMNNIKNALVQAQQPGADLAKIGADIAQNTAQLSSLVKSSAYNGQNWLDGSTSAPSAATPNPTVNLVASFNRDSAGATTVGTIDISTQALIGTASGTTGQGILEGGTGTAAATGSPLPTNFTTLFPTPPTTPPAATSWAGQTTVTASVTQANVLTSLKAMSGDADKVITALQGYAANLGATQTRLSTQQNFIQSLQNNLTKGVSALVDADMNQASTRLQALQTQQQLGVQSLSIANQSSQLILKLFNG